jgi:hypothetical protein
MSPPGRPKGESLRPQAEGSPVSPPGRPKGEFQTAQPEGTPVSEPQDAQSTAEYIPFEEFRTGLPHGRFRIIVNPTLAGPFVTHVAHTTQVALAMIGPGLAAALLGYPWTGGLLVAAGILLRRVIKAQAPRILLYLATHIPSVYEQATQHGVMEVRRA